MFIPVTGGQGISRPFVVGLILLLVFLGMQSDFVPPRSADSPAAEEPTVSGKDSTKERIILELSKSNEKLEKELQQLQQHLLLLKHAAHQHGIEHSSRLGTMLYDDGFLLPGDGNKTVVNTDISPHETAEIATLEKSHDTRLGALPSDTFSENSSMHEVPQHSHRTHHQAQQAVSSP